MCVFLAVFSLSYIAAIFFHLKLPRYYPLEHAWKWVNEKGVPSMAWYGITGLSFLVGCIAALGVAFVLGRKYRSADESRGGLEKVLALIAVVCILAALAYTMQHEFAKWGVLR